MKDSTQTLTALIDGLVDQRDPRSLRSTLIDSLPFARLTPEQTQICNERFRLGVTSLMIRDGGWKPRRRPERQTPERLWEAYPHLDLQFGEVSQDLIRDLICQPVLSPDCRLPIFENTTIGDELLLFLAARVLDGSALGEVVASHRCFSQSPLCSLTFPRQTPQGEVDWSRWETPTGMCLLEALQPMITKQILAVERVKMGATTGATLRLIGEAQTRAAQAYLHFVDRVARRDLARCYLDALSVLVSETQDGRDWIAHLSPNESVTDRARAAEAAQATLAVSETLFRWHKQARESHFLDDDYNQQQILLSSWDGELIEVCEAAAARLRELNPLAVASSR